MFHLVPAINASFTEDLLPGDWVGDSFLRAFSEMVSHRSPKKSDLLMCYGVGLVKLVRQNEVVRGIE